MPVDVLNLKLSVDLLALVGNDTRLHKHTADGGEWAGACPFCGGDDRFLVWPTKRRWWCRRCNRTGDPLGYVAERHHLNLRNGVDFRRACDLLGGVPTSSCTPPSARSAPPPPRAGPPPELWQNRARLFANISQDVLWSPAGAAARAWLNARGLAEDVLRHAGIGYNPRGSFIRPPEWGLPDGVNEHGNSSKLYLPRGLVIPCIVNGVVWYIKVRRLPGEPVACMGCKRPAIGPGKCQHCGRDIPKYLYVRRPGDCGAALYGAETLTSNHSAVLCEGELDALLLWQEAGHLAGVATLGSASNTLDLTIWSPYLLPMKLLLLAYDLDAAGKSGAAKLVDLTARARRVNPPRIRPNDKDLTDFHLAGGRLRDWLALELARYGVPPTTVPISKRSEADEDEWWARTFSERRMPDPAPDKPGKLGQED